MAKPITKAKKSARAKNPPPLREHRKFMRSYTTDSEGNKVLIGLTLKETVAYEEYRDSAAAAPKAGKKIAAKPGKAENQFQALAKKHEAALKQTAAAKPRRRAGKPARGS